jgi:hypothetical protein
MAASKDTRRAASGTKPFFLKLFRDSKVPKERERAWHEAMRHSGTGNPPLRFPVYEHLYLLNAYTQEMVKLLDELSRNFAVNRESLPHYKSLLQYVRASTSHGVIEFMAGVEQTEAWLHERQLRTEEEKLRDPDDVYISVRQREAERVRQGLPQRIQFLDKSVTPKPTAAKMRGASKGN